MDYSQNSFMNHSNHSDLTETLLDFSAVVVAAYQPGNVEACLLDAKSYEEREMLLGEIEYLRGNFKNAKQHLHIGVSSDDPNVHAFSLMILSCTYAALGETSLFHHTVSRLREIGGSSSGSLMGRLMYGVVADTLFAPQETQSLNDELFSLDMNRLPLKIKLYILLRRSKQLLFTGRFEELLCFTQVLSTLLPEPKYPLIYTAIYTECAIAYSFLGKRDQAKHMLWSACDLTKNDGILISIMQFSMFFDNFLFDALLEKWPDSARKLNHLWNSQMSNWFHAHNLLTDDTLTGQLTRNEYRVALFATYGMSNKEISAHLNVSTATIKTILTHVFQKLHIKSRRELSENLFVFQKGE